MEVKKLSIKAFSLTCSLLWGGAVLLVGSINLYRPGYGQVFLSLVSSCYPGYDGLPSLQSVITGTAYAMLDGLVCGTIFAWLYNVLANHDKCSKN